MPGPGRGLTQRSQACMKARPRALLRGLGRARDPGQGQEAPPCSSRGGHPAYLQASPRAHKEAKDGCQAIPNLRDYRALCTTTEPTQFPQLLNPSQKDNSCQVIANPKKV